MSHPPNGRTSAEPSAKLKTTDSNLPEPTVILWEPNKVRKQVVHKII